MMEINKQQYGLLGLSYFGKIGPQAVKKLEAYFPDISQIFRASSRELEKAGLKEKIAQEFLRWRNSFDLKTVLDDLEKKDIKFLTWHDSDYPYLLREIAAPPYLLYYLGANIQELGEKGRLRLAIVGSRKHSAYGEKIIKELLPPLINAGVEIVSGLAQGIDTLAHKLTLDLGGRTIAVLGSGLCRQKIYPSNNYALATKIKATGFILSEFPPDTPPLKQNFPQRNRIISGLSQATLLIEAPQKSGALITAAYALEQNREVLAVPGNIFSLFSIGTNNLLKSGAQLINGASDLLEIFNLKKPNFLDRGRPEIFLKSIKAEDQGASTETEKLVYKIIKQAQERGEYIFADEIIRASGLEVAVVNRALSALELRGVAKNQKNGYALN